MKTIKYNLGCGFDTKKGYINVDYDKIVKPDIVKDLSSNNWSSGLEKADYIEAYHILEHLEDTETFLLNCKNLLKKGGILHIKVPCCFNTNGFEDPTHKKFFTPESFHHLSINIHYRHYNTSKKCDLFLLEKKLYFSSRLDKIKHYCVRVFLNYSLSLSFVKEISVVFRK